jgi:cell wall-associated NlpC family hydrolase
MSPRVALLMALGLASAACSRTSPRAAPAYPPYSAYGSGPYGYGAPPAAMPAPANDPGLLAAAFARSRVGAAYCWGGNGPACYDCSGLTTAAWKHAGRSIPRTSEAQVEGLAAVSLSELRPGDIVWRPGHVGLYVGDGLVIHAPGTGKTVTYQSVTRFQRAVRP